VTGLERGRNRQKTTEESDQAGHRWSRWHRAATAEDTSKEESIRELIDDVIAGAGAMEATTKPTASDEAGRRPRSGCEGAESMARCALTPLALDLVLMTMRMANVRGRKAEGVVDVVADPACARPDAEFNAHG